jgi:flagellar hook-associated protein 1 FlgK
MSGNVFSVGISGLNAARAGLATTGHNISNVATPGYTRQSVAYEAATPQFTNGAFFGSGVEVSTVARQYSHFLETQRLAVESQAGYLDAYLTQARQIDNALADPRSGLAPALQDFFAGMQDLASSPQSVPSRQSVLSLGESLVSRFQALDARLNDLRNGVNVEVTAAVDRINGIANQIAALNDRIASSRASPNAAPNDLLDQRDKLVGELNQQVKVSTAAQSDGTLSVFIGTGQSLVVGARVIGLEATRSLEDGDNVAISLVGGQKLVELPTSLFQGGRLGGLLSFRESMLDQAQNTFGRIAITLAESFNEQHRLGQDLRGALGQDFFEVPDPMVVSRSNNAGTAQLSASVVDSGALTLSDYRITRVGTNYVVRRLPDGGDTTYASLPQTFDGVTVSVVSGAMAEGDSFMVRPTRRGATELAMRITDTAQVAAAAPVRTIASLSNSGSARMTQGAVSSVAGVPLPGDITLTYDESSNAWNATGAVPAAGPFTHASGQTIAFNGLSFTITGTPANGDAFRVTNNASGVSDNRNALLLAGLQTATTLAGGTTSYQGGYGQMVSQIGNQTRELEVQLEAQQALVDEATTAQQAYSGVNLDEEAANLMRFQQAYQASGKVLQIASQLFQQMLEIN